jgi:hypothetical protein
MKVVSVGKPIRIHSVSPLSGFHVLLEFSDGTRRDVDLSKYRRGPIFEPIRSDPDRFREVAVDARAGTICWPNGADIDPDVLYHGWEPAWATETTAVTDTTPSAGPGPG